MTQVGLPLLTLENSTEETQHASGLDSPPHDAYGENQSPLEGQGESTQLSKLVVDTRRDGSPGTRPWPPCESLSGLYVHRPVIN